MLLLCSKLVITGNRAHKPVNQRSESTHRARPTKPSNVRIPLPKISSASRSQPAFTHSSSPHFARRPRNPQLAPAFRPGKQRFPGHQLPGQNSKVLTQLQLGAGRGHAKPAVSDRSGSPAKDASLLWPRKCPPVIRHTSRAARSVPGPSPQPSTLHCLYRSTTKKEKH